MKNWESSNFHVNCEVFKKTVGADSSDLGRQDIGSINKLETALTLQLILMKRVDNIIKFLGKKGPAGDWEIVVGVNLTDFVPLKLKANIH